MSGRLLKTSQTSALMTPEVTALWNAVCDLRSTTKQAAGHSR
jgi:hypothetical protein